MTVLTNRFICNKDCIVLSCEFNKKTHKQDLNATRIVYDCARYISPLEFADYQSEKQRIKDMEIYEKSL